MVIEKVMLVDDEPQVLTALRRNLEHRFNLYCADSGEEALILLEAEGPFAAVVSDMRMPGMNGVELLSEILRISPQTVRIILSGQSDIHDVIRAINSGAVFRYHTKPVSTEILIESLEVALLQHEREKHLRGIPLGNAKEATELRRAIREGQLLLYLQPQASLDDGHVHGAEALVRWNHPERGVLLPADFLPIAGAAGLLGEITQWVMNAACAELRRWQEAANNPMRIAVNITAMDIADPDFPHQVRDTLALHDVSPQMLELELTEGAAVEDLDRAHIVLQDLANFGIRFSVDDFGTGYSSLGWLRRLPITKLKIDRMFIEDVADDPKAYHFLASVMTLARDLKLMTVAEGIETPKQMERVRSTGCDLVQGYLLAKPMPTDAFPAWLANRRHSHS